MHHNQYLYLLFPLGPFALICIFVAFNIINFKASCLIFKIISVTSSITPGIEENSCVIPSILIEVTAAPLIEDSKNSSKHIS